MSIAEVAVAVPKSVITDAELEVLKVLWHQEPCAAKEITAELYEEVNSSSIGTVAIRSFSNPSRIR